MDGKLYGSLGAITLASLLRFVDIRRERKAFLNYPQLACSYVLDVVLVSCHPDVQQTPLSKTPVWLQFRRTYHIVHAL